MKCQKCAPIRVQRTHCSFGWYSKS